MLEHGDRARGSRSARPRSSSAGCASRRPPAPRPRRGSWIRTSSASRTTSGGALGTKVTLARSRKGGRIIIEFYSDEELGRLYDRLIGGAA